MKNYDIVGDIHGCADKLEQLLQKMGYDMKGNVYTHPTRKVIFLGDFIDRGAQQKRTLDLVRPMIKNGEALSVMGNHEFNAICYATKNRDMYVRKHTDKNTHQHEAFLEEFPFGSDEYHDAIEWFKTLPVYLDFDHFGVVHACWHSDSISDLDDGLTKDNRLTDQAILNYKDKKHPHHQAIEILLKGPEFVLPEGISFKDKDGHERKSSRLKWWADPASPLYDQLEFGGAELNEAQIQILNQAAKPDQMDLEDKVIFVGHYWLTGIPEPLSDKVACVDYSVAKDGKMTGYSYYNDHGIKKGNFVWVD